MKLILLFAVVFSSNVIFAQNAARRDTSVVKFVRALSTAITDRMNAVDNNHMKYRSDAALMFVDKSLVTIDSLYKYKFSDIKGIDISFEHMPLYGFRTTYGVVIIRTKEKEKIK